MKEYRLFYRQPASAWEEALILGNGPMGMAVFGRPDHEILRLNEESLWEGYEAEYDNPEGPVYLPAIRKALWEHRYQEAYELSRDHISSKTDGESLKRTIGTYRGAGDLTVSLKNHENTFVERQLNLLTGTAGTDTDAYTATHFVSMKANVCVSRFAAKDAPLTFDVRFDARGGGGAAEGCTWSTMDRQDKNFSETFSGVTVSGKSLSYTEQLKGPGALRWAFALTAETDGTVSALADGLRVENASILTLFYDAATSFFGEEPLETAQNRVANAAKTGFDALLSANQATFSEMMTRSVLSLESDPDLQKLPTDERLARMKAGQEDVGLYELYFNFGKYLLISSSSPLSRLPANLQGIWTKDNTPPWRSDYHTNINLQMNYWPAEVTGLGDCTKPFFDYLELLYPYGKKTAKTTYGARGWVMHHATTPWGVTAQIGDPVNSVFTCATPWCCRHILDHYAYTGDQAFLKKYWYLLRESALFFFDYLAKDPATGWLVTAPSVSPENTFLDPATGKPFRVCAGPTMDSEILTDFFSGMLDAAADAGETDETFLAQLKETLDHLPPIRVSSDGRVMEWLEEYAEAEPGHRHISHLYALYPANLITKNTPELWKAARKTIEYRLAHSSGMFGCTKVGWSNAWFANMYARLFDGEAAAVHLRALLTQCILPNFFDSHPPFQIDANFGGCAGITSVLLADTDEVVLLPALPPTWKNGSFENFRLKGGKTVSCVWRDGKVVSSEIKSL